MIKKKKIFGLDSFCVVKYSGHRHRWSHFPSSMTNKLPDVCEWLFEG